MKNHSQLSRNNLTRLGKVWRIIITGIVITITISMIMALAGYVASKNLENKYPAPGRLIDVGGFKMHINCIGEGSPTVILDAGLQDFSIFWSFVQPEAAEFSRVCVYDRAGYGWSEPSPFPRTSEIMVAELETLLENSGEKGPYVLVGHSFGGALVRLFAHQHPKDVVGIVLVDAAPGELFERIPVWRTGTEQMIKMIRLLVPLRSIGLLALVPGAIPGRGLPEGAQAQYKAIVATTRYLETSISESEAFEENLAQVANADMNTFGDLPLVVISDGKWKPLAELPGISGDENQLLWREMQSVLTNLSSNSEQIIAEKSDHFIQLQQPQLVIEAIEKVVRASKNL
jgi:pimeloyl-ACP methyl ester carboxylesterase